MARAKKNAETPKVDLGAEIFAALRELEKTKGIPVDYMVERMKQGMANAYRKDREDRRDVPADNVVVDLSEKGLFVHVVKTVVEEVEDTALEIHIDAARNMDPNVQLGDNLSIPVNVDKFSRIAAQTFKQVLIQGIREAERGMVYESYADKAQELLTAPFCGSIPMATFLSASARATKLPTPLCVLPSRSPAKPTPKVR